MALSVKKQAERHRRSRAMKKVWANKRAIAKVDEATAKFGDPNVKEARQYVKDQRNKTHDDDYAKASISGVWKEPTLEERVERLEQDNKTLAGANQNIRHKLHQAKNLAQAIYQIVNVIQDIDRDY